MKKLILLAVIGLGIVSCTTQKIQEDDRIAKRMETHHQYLRSKYQTIYPGRNFQSICKRNAPTEIDGENPLVYAITPIAQQNKKGSLGSPYAAADYTSINPEFGTMQDFKHMVNEAHRLGFKVFIDWVANHTGWDHVWTKTHPEFYLKDPDGKFHIASGMDDIIELDYKNQEMRQAMIDAMKFWVQETDIDGFRCDLASWVEVDFWEQARPEVEK
jgi:hypothetical protein